MRKKLLIAATSRLSLRSNDKPLSFEVSDSVGPSYIQWREWSYGAASVPSDMPNGQKGRKKVSKHERRAMVESYVNKYRTMNAGKFPTATDVQKQVGGGYYFVREIIQELEYKSKMNSSNSMDENLLKKEQLSESKLPVTRAAKVSSDNTRIAKERHVQSDSQSVVSDDRESVNAGYENIGEKKGLQQMSSSERRLSKEVEIISRPGNHCIASESNLLEKGSDDPYPSSLQMPNDVKTKEAVSSHSDFVAPASHLPQEENKRASSPFSDKYGTVYDKAPGTVYDKAPGHESGFVDMENRRKMEEKCIEKAGYEKSEQSVLEYLYEEPSHSSLQVDVKTGKDVSSYSSDSIAPERHVLKEEIVHVSASFIDKSGSSHSKSQSHDMENHPIVEEKSFEKAGHERNKQDALKDLPGMDGPNDKMEQSQRSLEWDESKIDNSKKRETSGAVVSEKSTLWGNLKSLADGIINIWRKL